MDITFKCPHCSQDLAVDESAAGTEFQCPSCSHTITVPQPEPQNLQPINPAASNAAAREEKHFSVPMRDKPSESLIEKPKPPLVAAAKDTGKKVRSKTIRHSDCVEVGKDKFDEVVSDFLSKIGQENIINIITMNYSHLELASRQMVTDYGLTIIYKG